MVRYRYSPLPGESNRYIRLATIHPGKFEDDIVVSFHISPFPGDGSSRYEALSYAWGSKKDPQPVYVSRCDAITTSALQNVCQIKFEKISTTRNLVISIRHLRYVDQPRVMWVDALCINQADQAEKGPQVAMMGEIFRLARRVIAWLGPEKNDSSRAMGLMGYLGAQVEVDFVSHTLRAADGCDNPSLADVNEILPLKEKELRSIYYLISKRWFERLWIRQEITLANSEAVIKCGFSEVKWIHFRQALVCLYMKPKDISKVFNQFNYRIIHLDGFIWQPRNASLMNLLRRYGSSHCLDPLDRLYAIMALLPQKERAFIPSPDYSISHVELYTDVTLRWMNCYQSLSILRQCSLRDDGPCPTWVPDWSKPASSNAFLVPFPGQNASSNLAAWHELPQPGVLRVTGISKSRVKQCHYIPDIETQPLNVVFDEIRQVLLKLDQGKQCTVDAYARLFCRDQFSHNFDPPDEMSPSLDEAKQVVERMLSEYEYNYEDYIWPSAGSKVLTESSSLGRTQVIQAMGSYVGFAPESAQAGDEICCVLGCPVPLLLRPLEKGKFKLVGPCFVLGLLDGEAFLGRLPENVRPVSIYDKKLGGYWPGFKDVLSDETFYEDPWLESLPVDLDDFRRRLQEHPNAMIDVDPEILRERGVDLKYFDLV
ncbi:HET-domain-containing protein [Hypoxylon fuscum]|nr:HET-domain-containing protein [Hypoxylon fuscum]